MNNKEKTNSKLSDHKIAKFLSNIYKKVEDFFFAVYSRMEKSELLISIKQGFIMVIPIFMIGAFALLLMNFPIPSVSHFIGSLLDGKVKLALRYIYDATFGVASLYIVVAVSYMYSTNFTKKRSATNLMICIVALASYFAFLGINPKIGENGGELHYISYDYLNVNNVFSALVTAVLSTKLFFFFSKLLGKLKKSKYVVGAEIDFRRSLSSILPMAMTIAVFALVAFIIHLSFVKAITIFSDVNNFNELVIALFGAPFLGLGRNLGSGILIIFFQCAFWFFGIHGGNVLNAVSNDLFSNIAGEIVTKTTLDTFVLMGGSGCAICLLLAIFFFSKAKNSRSIAKNASVPMIFNISEILVFGLPIVLNPILLVPFILVPVVNLLITYSAISTNMVTPLLQGMAGAQEIMWTTPIFFSGYYLTGSISGVILQIVNVTVGALIYWPFIRMNDRIAKRKFALVVKEMTDIVIEDNNEGKKTAFVNRSDYISKTAIDLANNLRYALEENEIELYYQPLVQYDGKVKSAEALLRWRYNNENHLFPPLLVAIAIEDNTFDALTKYIIEYVLRDAKEVIVEHNIPISFSINIQSYQLTDNDFVDWIIEKVKEANLPKDTIYLELTEEAVLKESVDLLSIFEKLREANIRLAIDDFSMGHTSINYLKNNRFDFVKLDGMLTKNVIGNSRTKDIVETIIRLGNSLGFSVIAEYVEDQEQMEKLHSLGCDIYQGYLYSPAIPKDQFIEFYKRASKK